MLGTGYIECGYDLRQFCKICLKSFITDNSNQAPQFMIIKEPWWNTVSDNTFHQVFLIYMQYCRLRDVKHPHISKMKCLIHLLPITMSFSNSNNSHNLAMNTLAGFCTDSSDVRAQLIEIWAFPWSQSIVVLPIITFTYCITMSFSMSIGTQNLSWTL